MRPKKSHELRIQNVIKGGWNKLTNKTSTLEEKEKINVEAINQKLEGNKSRKILGIFGEISVF